MRGEVASARRAQRGRIRGGELTRRPGGTTMVVNIPIRILVSYDSTILLWLNDTYRDGILIW
jgi:hypothetical protein